MKICNDCEDYEIRLITITHYQAHCVNNLYCRQNALQWEGKTYEYCPWCRYKFDEDMQFGTLGEICCNDYEIIMGEIVEQQNTCPEPYACSPHGPKFDGKYSKPFKYCPWCSGNLTKPPSGHRQDYGTPGTTFDIRQNLDKMRNWKKNDNINNTN